mgnify:CR=1 FL=1
MQSNKSKGDTMQTMQTINNIKGTIVPTHIEDIRAGDVIVEDGFLLTISSKDIKYDSFMGYTLRGDSYRLGTIPVQKFNVFHCHK